MSTKKSIRLSDEAKEACGLLSRGDVNYSGSINSVFARYNFLIKTNMPNLSKGEELAFSAIYGGRMFGDTLALEVGLFDWMVSEAFEYNPEFTDILNTHDIDPSEFLERVSMLSSSQKLAIIDMVQRLNHS